MPGLRRAASVGLSWAAPVSFALLLISMFLIRHRNVSDAVSVSFVLVAALTLAAGQESRAFLRGLGLWLGGAVVLVLAATLLSRDVTVERGIVALQGLVLLACFVLCMSQALRRFGPEKVLQALFAAGAVSAALSIAIHLGTGHSLTDRMIMVGRASNPIPSAAAIAACGLAGLALLRSGALAHRWRASLLAMGVILAAMVLTQSRGPLIGVVLGGALLLLPDAWARRNWLLVLLAFPAASSLVLLEDQIRTLMCQGDLLFCRPSHRLELWRQSIDLILAHPLTGMGVGHRLGDGASNNPQNAALGTALYFGIPFLLAAIAGAALLLRRLARRELTLELRWAAAMMLFSAVYFAFEPSPFAFYNAHYLFLWLPVTAILVAPKAAARQGRPEARHSG